MIKLVDARKGLYDKCVELFHDEKVAESIYMYLCDGIEECDEVELKRKRGEWIEKEVYNLEVTTIEQMQSARCSSCGKYHTTPFSYYFDNFNYCPNCGARMKGVSEE